MGEGNAIVAKVATFIDYENIRLRLAEKGVDVDKIDFVLKFKSYLLANGIGDSLLFVYDDFENPFYKNKEHLNTFAGQGINTRHVLCNKDSADIEMCLEAFEVCLTKDIEKIVIVSCDRDMFPLIKKIRQYGKVIILSGATFNTSNYIIKFVDLFIPMEEVSGIGYDKDYIIKKDIIDSAKRINDLFMWAQGKATDLEKEFCISKIREKLYETYDYSRSIYTKLIQNSIIDEYNYVYNGKSFTGVRFIQNLASSKLIKGEIPSFT